MAGVVGEGRPDIRGRLPLAGIDRHGRIEARHRKPAAVEHGCDDIADARGIVVAMEHPDIEDIKWADDWARRAADNLMRNA